MKGLLLGRVGKTHGLKGELKFNCPEENLDYINQVLSDDLMCWVKTKPGTFPIYFEYFRSDGFIVKIKQVDTVDDAKIYVQGDVFVEGLEDESEDVIPVDKLISAIAFLEGGEKIGEIVAIEEYPAHDMAVILCDGREVLIPLVDDYFVDFVAEDNRLILSLPEGLLELNH